MEKQNRVIKSNNQDEIDLKDVWKIVIKRKYYIVLITLGVTFLAIFYAYTKKPTYEAKALFEVGYYSSGYGSANTLLENPSILVKRIEVEHINNRSEKEEATLEQVFIPKGSNNIIELVTHASSNDEAVQKIIMIEQEIKERHQVLLDSYLSFMRQKMENIQAQRDDLVVEKNFLNELIIEKAKSIDKIAQNNPVLAAIYAIDLNSKSSELALLKSKIYALNTQLTEFSNSVLTNNIKPTMMIGNITMNKYPIKPKKSIIVVVAFISGFILSLFSIFLIEFLSKKNDE
ncbi:MAG: hypothetical protein KA253_05145 [Campylobacteraceae bacterium]|nr:hypothetical protein [Campylobacteraceae bacterium]